MLVKIFGSAVNGIEAATVTLEVNVGGGFGFVLVGLPDNAVRESKERVLTAIRNNSLEWPRAKITVNMAPADLRKAGSGYDLGLAVGILAASGQMSREKLADYMIVGELSLDGNLKPVKGALPIAIQARKQDFKGLLIPEQNASEAAIVNKLEIIPVAKLADAIEFLNGSKAIKPLKKDTRDIFEAAVEEIAEDFADVRGQEFAKRALEVAAAGGHNVLLVGPPGSGKTMLTKRLPSILPPLSLHEALETTVIHSVAGTLGPDADLMAGRPFRSPHHTLSDIALVGGGSNPQPGEISLAHNGVLFLDELPEFKKSVLETLRQPLEERAITVSRARATATFPANFMFAGSMNPCPCGYYSHPEKDCICSTQQIHKYWGKISGPLMDRIDIQVEVPPVSYDELANLPKGEASKKIRERVWKARKIQLERFAGTEGVYTNAMIPPGMIREVCRINKASGTLLRTAMEKLRLSARAYDRILKVSRTIADLGGKKDILVEHIAEAIHYRNLDRESWIQ